MLQEDLSLNRDIINRICLVLGIGFVAYYLACGLGYRFDQSMLWVWPVTGIALISKYMLAKKNIRMPGPVWLRGIVSGFVAVCMVFFILVECFVISGFVSKCPDDVDYVILLGAKTGSLTIERRIDTAAGYLAENPESMVICTGGQGPDEEMPEGEYMKRGLIARGISPDRIIVEDKSTSTSENIAFSRRLISDENASVAVVSNNYHVSRAKAIARRHFDGDVYAIPMASNLLSLPHYMVREFFTVTVDLLRGNLAF